MPRPLPGLFWDHDRQRYFPLAARQTHSEPVATSQQTPPTRVNRTHALADLRSVLHTAHRDALIQYVLFLVHTVS